ncbi:hypothetical protein MAR_020842 [Mya arenaria]|uniref:HAT C-terminal dimerisation domain-containing protein n=1 Tax=Mya arenaria TaxID=6604 RepID=A0ABY7E657_MYAAR|nr:hypothetical protein MAR_020842 [Mya arenaria]
MPLKAGVPFMSWMPNVVSSTTDSGLPAPVWWRSHENDYPNLSRLAKHTLHIPATSVASERVFSVAGDVVTATRSRLAPDMVDSSNTMNDQCREEGPDDTRNMNLDLSSCSDERETTSFSFRPLRERNMRDGVISLDDTNIPPKPNQSPVTKLQNPSQSRNVNKDQCFGTHIPERANTTHHNPSPDPEIEFPNLNRNQYDRGDTACRVAYPYKARRDNPQSWGNNPEQPDPHFRVKPPKYDRKDEVYECLVGHRIYKDCTKLAAQHAGILTELQRNERTDINVLTQKLRERYQKVFRAKLRGRARKVGESISDLAQDIKKMTILAYPNAHIEVLETIAKNHFIDSFNEQEIRLKLREADPTTLSQADQMAIRLEAYKIADKQRYETIPARQWQCTLCPHIAKGFTKKANAQRHDYNGMPDEQCME